MSLLDDEDCDIRNLVVNFIVSLEWKTKSLLVSVNISVVVSKKGYRCKWTWEVTIIQFSTGRQIPVLLCFYCCSTSNSHSNVFKRDNMPDWYDK